MSERADARFRAPVEAFLRGDHGVLDFSHAYFGVVNEVVDRRPLQGLGVDLSYELEVWEAAGWDTIRPTRRGASVVASAARP